MQNLIDYQNEKDPENMEPLLFYMDDFNGNSKIDTRGKFLEGFLC